MARDAGSIETKVSKRSLENSTRKIQIPRRVEFILIGVSVSAALFRKISLYDNRIAS